LSTHGKTFGLKETGPANAKFMVFEASIKIDDYVNLPSTPTPGSKPTSGTAGGWLGIGPPPPMTSGQIGHWADVTAKLDGNALPLTLTAPLEFVCAMNDGTTRKVTLPAGTYQGLTFDDDPNPGDKGVGMAMTYPTDIAGVMLGIDSGKTWLRVDVLDSASAWVTGIT
jgi:hypothetical protein